MNTLNLKDVPYEELEKVGISKKAFLDFPEEIRERLMNQRLTPFLKITMAGKDLLLKLLLKKEQNGKVKLLLFRPRKEMQEGHLFSKKEKRALEEGKVVRKQVEGDKESKFYQLDLETNTLMSVPVNKLSIPSSIANVSLGQNQQQQLREGNPVELEIDGSKVTCGVDLNTVGGFKSIRGDIGDWAMKQKVDWDRITPGATGFWLCSENGWEKQELLEKSRGLSM